ncbi:MAG TPA: hypothetical protein HA252_05075 [Candidatus Diapherotrites archaeon]|uniref:Class III signal peptide-containing protein n=1 Tax=Candidatus Iainarchaeum sp. TaxID=3101447 RepID=A0A7J4JG73_9ARCH|nr:hypothetical protein [Candidatus Diapherotrites archaeon]
MRSFGQKGQESAPFELLVAVVIMTFVILLGYRALDQVAEIKCKGEVEGEMEKLKTTLENIVKQKGKENLGLYFPACQGEKDTSVRIKGFEDERICAAFCGGSRKSCTLLSYSSPKFSISKCLRGTINTTFGLGETCTGQEVSDPEKYEAQDFKADIGIDNGNYVLVSKFDLTGSYPILCAYKRKAG